MKRRTFLLGSVATLAAAAAGCSNNQPAATTSAATSLDPATKAELSLSYWDKNQTPTVEANIKTFNAKYPNVKVTTNLAGYRDYWNKLRTQAQGQQLPDVFWMNGPNVQLYAGNGMLATLDDVTNQGIAWANYPKALVDLYSFGGHHYGIPKDFDTIGVFYNKTIFKAAGVPEPAAGWTWDDFHTKAKAISDWGKAQGIWGCATTINGDGQGTYYNTMLQAGGYIIKDGKSGFDDPKSIEGLQCWADWVKDGSVAPPKIVTDTDPNSMLQAGKSAMYWAGDWTASGLAKDLASKVADFGAVELPKKERQATVIHGLAWVVAKQTKNAAAATALAVHMGAEASQAVDAKNGTAIPAYTGTQSDWVKAFPQWNCQLFVDAAANYSFPYPVSKNTDAWASKEGDYLTPAFAGETTVAEAAKKLAAFMNDALAKES